MATQTILIQGEILHKAMTEAEWAALTPVLRKGELGVATDTHVLKIGDGVTAWTALPGVQAHGLVASLDSESDIDALAASQGKALNERLQGIESQIENISIPIENSLTSDSVTSALAAAQGKNLKTQIDGLSVEATPTSAGMMSAVDKTKLNGLHNCEVVNGLSSSSVTAALSAAQGKALNDTIGPKSALTTNNKNTIVAAINEVNAKVRETWVGTQAQYNALTKKTGTLYLIYE